MKTCQQCKTSFQVTDEDRGFYEKMGVTEPTLCPSCRQQRRLAFRNERTLYKRQCSGSGRSIVSIYPSDVSFPVYHHSYFFSDNWNAMSHGSDFDFSRPFFEQFHELALATPHLATYSHGNENAEYGNLSSWNKDCYMLFESDNSRDCYYNENSYRNKDTADCTFTNESEGCYGCVDVLNSYNLRYALNCKSCSNSWFLKNCIGCKNCFGCVNLKNQEYYLWNQPLSKDEYQQKLLEMGLDSHSNLQNLRQRFLEFAMEFPHKYLNGFHNEDCTGDYLNHCKNAQFCFDSSELRDCKYVYQCEHIKDGYDLDTYGGVEGAELVYECHSVGRGSFNVAFGNNVWQNLTDVWYADTCIDSKDLFGCISMRHAQYCILNKQYSREDYFDLRSRIVEHMRRTGEYGEFFPVQLSPFAYNETVANFYYPLAKNEVLSRGWKWSDYEHQVKADKTIPAARLPDTIKSVPDDVLDWAITCESTGKPFKVTSQELKFYRDRNIPLPHLHPDERYRRRMSLRNPRQLWDRECVKCGMAFQTTYATERSEKIYCENCYLREVY
ncbi:MAG: zinc-ribbon domain containing protein [Candidatus Peregrinibacteria bacterium]